MLNETTLDLITELESLDVKLTLDNHQLRYSAPKGVMTADLIDRVKSNKENLIALLHARIQAARLLSEPIPLQPAGALLPLTFAQQRFWFLDQLAGGNSPIYNMLPIVMQIDGALNIECLQRAMNTLLTRHQVLSNRFEIQGDAPCQLPNQGGSVPISHYDFSQLDSAEIAAAIAKTILDEGERPFDLVKGAPLLRIGLIHRAPEQHILVLTMHHIVGDGWTMGILVDEFSQLYRAYQSGQPSALPPLPIQYGDFAAWERQRLRGAFLQEQLYFWKRALAGAPTFLELPTDRPRPRLQSYSGSTYPFSINQELTTRLQRTCQQLAVTPFMLLLTTFGALLSRYTGQDDLIIGAPLSVRAHPQCEGLIGLFLNTIPLRIDLTGNPNFNVLLQRVKHHALAAYQHGEIPFDELLQALRIDRALNHTPLFQVLFVLQNAPVGTIQITGLSMTPLETENTKTPFDLVLSMEERTDHIYGRFRYNTDLFDEATILRLADHFVRLLDGALANTEQPINLLPMLNAAELQVQHDWRGGSRVFSVTDTLVSWFERQVIAHPNNIALVYDATSWSYFELNQRANHLAHRLQQLGVQPENRVGLCMERSAALVAALIGILKTGTAYVPLDPTYPADRLAFMAEDAGLKVVITDTATAGVVPASVQERLEVSTVNFDTVSNDLKLNLDINSIAYVIYTSGSTGRPKGVAVTHANVVRLFLSTEELYGFTNRDVWTLFHSYAFDFSVWELWGALLYGGRLVVVPYWISRSPDAFFDLLQQQHVTVLNQTPSAFKQLMEIDRRDHGRQTTLRWVIFGGEALELTSLEGWCARHGFDQPQLVNMYGITETTVHVTYHRLTAADLARGGSVIGKPLPDLTLELRDRYDQSVPFGVAGEILVGGAGVARGYLNRPELTAQRFTTTATNERIYHSGDLARWRADGRLEYLGRSDLQVKIRGFRIELGEIQSQIAIYAGVSASVVIAQDRGSGNELIGYIAFQAGIEINDAIRGLREHLRQRLPDYMVPATLISLEKLPLTANGKIDTRALPAPDREQRTAQTPFVAPTTALEKLLAELWQDVLKIERIGCQDNFFELGGDSIKGAIFANRMQERIGSIFYVVALFEAPTIAELIAYMRIHYPEAVQRYEGVNSSTPTIQKMRRLDLRDLATLRNAITPLPPCPRCISGKKNRKAIFVLAPPRSGTTLLRVLLGGHSQLFAPPELELMPFNTLGERQRICSGRDAFWLEGTLRAVMALCGIDAEAAKALMAEREAADLTIKDFYGELQSWLDAKILVDKSPSYVLDRAILARIEETFTDPLYIHLHRHPYGMINSFEEAKLHQIFFRYPHNFNARELAELIWVHSHHNIFDFLAEIPRRRHTMVSFEAITAQPQAEMERLCAFLGMPFEPTMLALYEEKQKKRRMTDGIYAESKMLGDVKFHTHQQIDASVAERWRARYQEDFLSEMSAQMADKLGYNDAQAVPKQVVNFTPLVTTHSKQIDNRRPISLAQQRLWFFDQLEGASSAYNMPVALWLEGELNRPALIDALRAIPERHEVLRSAFINVGGEPICQILAALPPPLVIDLRLIDAERRASEAQRWLAEESARPFNLELGHLFRVRLIIINPQRHLLLINMHHIVTDGWSLGIVARELAAGYQARIRGTTPNLPPLPLQYSDYASWQRQWLSGTELTRQLNYWKAQLADLPSLLELPTDRPRPALQSYRGATLNFTLESQLSRELKMCADRYGVSLYMLLLTAFGVLLYRYSNQRIIALGSPSANRSRREIEALIGFFVNTLVMKLTIDPQQPFNELLMAVKHVALGAYSHQDVSFEQLVEALQPERNLSYSPLFQVMLTMRNAPLMLPEFDGLRVTPVEHENPIAKYDLTLTFGESERGLAASLEYNCDLFDEWRMRQLLDNLIELLRAVVVMPTQAVASLNLLSTNTRQKILFDWNHTERQWSGAATLHQLISATAHQYPERIAVCWGNQSLSYGVLEQQTNQLAHYLIAQGVQRGERIAVALERHEGLIVTLLAILKTGACYVPLDPSYPAERIAMIIEDAGSNWLITSSTLQALLPRAPHVLLLDTLHLTTSNALPNISVDPEDLAYVIFTSGSTGRPKGVMLSHRAVVNFIHSMLATPGISANDTVLAVTTISFDIAVLELWAPLVSGARIVIASENETRDGAALLQLLINWQITLLQATPATWRLLIASGWQSTPKLKALCGGEALPRTLASAIRERCRELWNMYGPTETAVWSTIMRIDNNNMSTGAAELIGRPIANTRLYILDTNMQPVPIGVAGELYIGGQGVAHGYLGRADLTVERFLADPFVEGEKIYRTGDLACYLSNGNVEYLGRADQQVKLRGFRIELGEIEQQLQQHPTITQCAVALDGNNEQARLVAFCVMTTDATLDAAQLRNYLAATLPEYMLPTLFVTLEQLPLTPNGKLDRKALRVPEFFTSAAPQRHIIAPRDATELKLAHIWQELLRVSNISIEDNFFELGGHSLIAVRLMARIAAEFDRHLPLAALFQGATIASLARLLRAERAGNIWEVAVPLGVIDTDHTTPPLFCAAGAGGNVLYLQPLSAALAGRLPFYGLQPPGLDGVTPVFTTVEALADHYLTAIQKIQPHGAYRLAGHSFGGLLAFEMARRLITAGETVEKLIILDTAAPQYFAPTGRDWSNAQWLAQVARIAGHQYGVDLNLDEATFAALANDDAQLHLLHQRLIACGVLSEQADLNYLRGFIQVYQANLRAVYQPPTETLPIPTLLVRSAELQPEHLRESQAETVRAVRDLGWGMWLTLPPQIIEIPGDHLTMLNPPRVEKLAEIIQREFIHHKI